VTGLAAGDLVGAQIAAFGSDERRLLILGGPGTGKTSVALLMARRILDAEPLRSFRRVLFLTFSRSATSELLRRLPAAVEGPVGRRIEICTFHSYAMSLLNAFRRYAGGSNEPITILTREEERLGLAPANAVTFDQLVPSALELLRSAPWLADMCRRRFAAVICDEFQDTSSGAADLLEVLAGGSRLICLADSDQVIFDWTDGTIAQRINLYRASGAVEHDLGYDSRRDPSNVIPRAAAALRRRDFASAAIAEACRTDRLRVLRYLASDDPFDVLVSEIRSILARGAKDIGLFFATNSTVNSFAERLRQEGIEHEIIGLSGAAGEAQVATAACARYVVGDGTWEDFLVAFGVFVAACHRGAPPQLAVDLVRDRGALDPGLTELLEAERVDFRLMADGPLETFLTRCESFWERLFVGRPRALWELGVRDLRGQTLGLRTRPLDRSVAASISRRALARRAEAHVDHIQVPEAPVRLMNVYQVKGREMDEVLLVHLPDDRDEWDPTGMQRLARVHYVSLSRARKRATIALPPAPKSFFAPYAGLCNQS